MKIDQKLKLKKFNKHFIELSYELIKQEYKELKKQNKEQYSEHIATFFENDLMYNLVLNNNIGASTYTAIFNDLINSEMCKKNCEIILQKNDCANKLYNAYKQNKKVKNFLESRNNIFKNCEQYYKELNNIVNELFLGLEYKEIIALALNYTQFTTIYTLYEHFNKKNIKNNNLNKYEKIIAEKGLKYATQFYNIMLELGQSGYLCMFSGRAVCKGQSVLTASLIDLAFKKNKIKGKASVFETDTHSFVTITYKNVIYVVDPTEYFGDFNYIAKVDRSNAKEVKNAKILNLKNYDNDAHLKVIEYFIRKFDVLKTLNDIVKDNDFVPIKLTKILAHLENNLSKMSLIVYPKGVMIKGREMPIQSYFEICLRVFKLDYYSGIGTEDFLIFDRNKIYYIDLSKAFDNKNKLKCANKFIKVLDSNKKFKAKNLENLK